MDYRKGITSILIVCLASFLSMTVLSFNKPEDDTTALLRNKSENLKIPKIEYPTVDLKGRHIPSFDYLVVFPECTSCSTFRITSKKFMDARPEKIFLILTPDTVGISPFLEYNRLFVAKAAKNSIYSDLLPGIYAK